MSENIITVESLSFSYGKNKVLDNISFHIKEGNFVGIIGPNGSAKSTLLKLILGLLKPDEGNIKLFGKPINEFKNFKKIGYISQDVRDFNQMFPATVREIIAANLDSKGSFFKKLNKEDNIKIRTALEIVGMEEFIDRKIGNLSGGQKQRVFIARALVDNPKILFMDEPLVGVDLDSQNKFYTLMEKLNKKYNITLVMISHDVRVISDKVNQLICLNKGKVYCHSSNQCDCGNIINEISSKNIDRLFKEH